MSFVPSHLVKTAAQAARERAEAAERFYKRARREALRSQSLAEQGKDGGALASALKRAGL